MKCDSVRFSKPVYDPAKPDGLGRTEFAAPTYDIELVGTLCVLMHGGRRYAYPLSQVAWSRESMPEDVREARKVRDGRR